MHYLSKLKKYINVKDHLFRAYAKFIEELILFTPLYAHILVCISGGGGGLGARNVSFSINFAYVLSKLSLIRHLIMNITSTR